MADYLSTVSALNRPGTHEANPIFGSNPGPGKLALEKLLPAAGIGYGLDRLSATHPKLALALALAAGGASFGIAAHNAQQGK